MEESDQIYEWDATITGGENGAGAWVAFPWDTVSCFGKKNQIPVRVEFDGIAYQGSIVNMGSGPCIGILKSIRNQLGKQAGDKVSVRLWRDTSERTVETPPELAPLLADPANAVARDFWEGLSYSHQREYAVWIATAKQASTRQNRAVKAIHLLGQQQKLK